MRFHRSLLKVTAINFVLCVSVLFSVYRYSSDENGKGIASALGWIYWLGMMVFIGPLVVPAETRSTWFSKEYGSGTVLLLLVNVFAVIAGNSIAYILAK